MERNHLQLLNIWTVRNNNTLGIITDPNINGIDLLIIAISTLQYHLKANIALKCIIVNTGDDDITKISILGVSKRMRNT